MIAPRREGSEPTPSTRSRGSAGQVRGRARAPAGADGLLKRSNASNQRGRDGATAVRAAGTPETLTATFAEEAKSCRIRATAATRPVWAQITA